MQIRRPSTNYILVYFFSGMPGKHPDTIQVESFLLQFCHGSTPICYNFTSLITKFRITVSYSPLLRQLQFEESHAALRRVNVP